VTAVPSWHPPSEFSIESAADTQIAAAPPWAAAIEPSAGAILWAAGIAVVVMGALYVLHLRTRDAGWVDVGWAALIGAFAGLFALLGSGAALPRLLAATIGAAWSLRLTIQLVRTKVLRPGEDPRYRDLRDHWGARAGWNFFWFFQAQGLLALLLASPFWLASQDPYPDLRAAHVAGLVLFSLGWLTASVADRQLHRFRERHRGTAAVCDAGLWRYSRHPNYFGEWLQWCGIAALAWPAPAGAWAVVAPTIMYVLLVRVTGIPPAERQSLASRGDAYREYQARTNAFFPGPVRTSDAAKDPAKR